jgi:hypothetical protein
MHYDNYQDRNTMGWTMKRNSSLEYVDLLVFVTDNLTNGDRNSFCSCSSCTRIVLTVVVNNDCHVE